MRRKKIQVLPLDLNSLEQYGRKYMTDVKGIPRWHNEDTYKIVINFAKLINVQLSLSDIAVSHRTSTKEDVGIIVKFISSRKRDELAENS